jgi:acylphosphatase
LIQRRVRVSGKVQGVGFRASTFNQVQKFPNLAGWVRNLPDGRVEAVFQGKTEHVLAIVAWCQNGPPTAQVMEIEVLEEVCDSSLGKFHVEI